MTHERLAVGQSQPAGYLNGCLAENRLLFWNNRLWPAAGGVARPVLTLNG